MFKPLLTPAEMAAWDREAMHGMGVRPEVLMESAAREAVAVLLQEYGRVRGRKVLVLAGPGNNGGDGFAMARLLQDRGAEVLLLHVRPLRGYRGEAGYNVRLAQRSGLAMRRVGMRDLAALPEAEVIVDALLGTGFAGDLRPEMAALVQNVNLAGKRAFVLAVDVPSGLDGFTGRPRPMAVKAAATATFGAAKVGLMLPRSAPYVGRLFVRDIGIPAAVKDRLPPKRYVITQRIMGLLPASDHMLHKGSAGKVLILGGSRGLTGAVQLAALGALRAGAGLVTMGCPGGLTEAVKAGLFEAMALPLGPGLEWDRTLVQAVASELSGFDALVVGPGLGREPEAGDFLAALLNRPLPPVVLDADALWHLARRPDLLQTVPAHAVLTPHPGEAARLAGSSVAGIEEDRFAAAWALAERAGAVAVLKGPGTVVAEPGGAAHLCPVACANLAVGGSGDVLSGVLGALLARGIPPLQSACLGVYWHGFCGQLLARDHPRRGDLAREIAHTLPRAAMEDPAC